VRVLHVTDHYPPVLGGIESHVAALAERQARRGDDVVVLTSTPATSDGRHCDDEGLVEVRRAPTGSPGRASALRHDLESFDVVHAHLSVVAPFTAPVAAAAAWRVPTLVTVHSLWSGLGPLPGAAAALAGLRGAPVTWTAVSAVAARHLAAQLPRDRRVRVLPNAVDVPARPATPERPAGEPVQLVSTMRVARRKRPLPLLRMMRALRRTVDVPVRLTVVGDGPLRPRLEARRDATGLGAMVSVTGRLDPGEVVRVLAASDVYVAPAVRESFGLAVLEARSVGLPIVGHAASGVTEFVRDGVEGLLGDSDADLVSRLARLVTDDALRHRIAEHNRVVRAPLTWSRTLHLHDQAYALARDPAPLRPRGVIGAVGA
jgi:glycosyltransferase involved in cell wall biosynthesis